MTKIPSPSELVGNAPQTYAGEMDRVTVGTDTEHMSPQERVQFWSTFESTVDAPSPSRLTGRIVDDVSAVFAGSKPAAIVSPHDLDDPLVVRLFTEEEERYKSLSRAGARDYYGGQSYFIGSEENVQALVKLYYGRGGDDSPLPADENFHRSVGNALGYSPEAIDSFIAQISSSKK